MLQIKTFIKSIDRIDEEVNAFLATINADDVKNIDVKDAGFIVIQYEVKEAWVNRLCCDCKYWDDEGDTSSVGGLCHECGGRRRFNCKACDRFVDVRD